MISSTYRLQFNHQFTFKHALKLIPYFSNLGITHIYASPLLKARKGSLHGYDVVDPTLINPEIGTLEEFEAFVQELHRHQMGLILDIVPNHMAACDENPWWVDVLKNGRDSPYASYFDIDWEFGNGKNNYRRFFDLNEYVALRMENTEAFQAAHQKIFEFMKKGLVDGLRIDHIDGLFDPYQYLKDLNVPYTIVEKVLIGNEELRPEWPVQGTVGYEFLNQLNGIFIYQPNHEAICSLYQEFTGMTQNSKDVKYECKKLMLNTSFQSDINRITKNCPHIKEALIEFIACFPVYRSYINPSVIHEEDKEYIQAAFSRAKKHQPSIDYAPLEQLLSKNTSFAMQVQQLTGPIMAKGLEDTMLYRYFPLASLNEVGGEPGIFGLNLEHFHKKNLERQKHYPYGLLSTTTHDTKRSEDVRARINVLSEIPELWKKALLNWKELNKQHKSEAPDANEEYLLYQNFIGTWPLEGISDEYIQRIQKVMEKSLNEEKTHTSWTERNESYQAGMKRFIEKILHSEAFVKSFTEFFEIIQEAGKLNSLSQLIIKLTSPGVPDIYQGNEHWTYSLVDPDNRRKVDYSKPPDEKTRITEATLGLRKRLGTLFTEGDYIPLEVEGELSNCVIAFERRLEGKSVVVVVSRFYMMFKDKSWKGTFLSMPEGEYRDIYTGKAGRGGRVCLEEVFEEQPFAVLKFTS